ncbi:MAG: 2-hydroxychromene-2-carboxylate isomerase/DsbA-like thioredoxin domain protein [Thermoleophilia bacterium]|nr:2-hydroxychromene-2-carboxylate isomerase/DsbA-like thioredoxin domain protein [Thermoleophilia bacterium]
MTNEALETEIERVQLEVWSDVACPWCFVGRRNLAVALQDLDPRERPDVTWRAYQLDPTIPIEGVERDAYFTQRFGDDVKRIEEGQERLTLLGEELGIEFRFDRQHTIANTFRAHRISKAAARHGVQDAVVDALFVANFEEGIDIGDPERLREVTLRAVIDPELTAKILWDAERDESVTEEVREDIALSQELGITAVPAFVADRALLVPGAVPPDALAKFLGEAAQRRANLDELAEDQEGDVQGHGHMHDHGDGHFHGAH